MAVYAPPLLSSIQLFCSSGSFTIHLSFLQVDVVYVGNIHVQHLQSVLMMFETGKPVLCEKPMTTSMKDTTTLIQAARDKGVFLMEVGYKHAASIPAIIMIKYTGSPPPSFLSHL